MARTDSSEPIETGLPTPTAGAKPPRGSVEAYTVVARRYRPQRFEDVVGQDHVVRALRNAIRMDRVAQAYVFSGTRGVGKTSMARIFSKALNCERGGPTETPCNECDTCRKIASGEDLDVIEIDGASNNGVEAVRELRQGAGLRPARSRYKIYYIDEVHMLSTSAFNALLKTLEEPPSHVKFVFATTEPNKIPITVLSRCQRFDFAGIGPDRIVDQLVTICEREGVEADREGLHVVARRASGSMRDAQSLLEQLLSAGGGRLTADRVHELLGIAGDDRVLDLLDAMADRDAAEALRILDRAVDDGVQPTDVLNSAIEFVRDVMVLAAGADIPALAALPGQVERLQGLAGRWSLDSVLAAQQILAETRGRLRGSPHTRLLVELAFCRVSRLEDLAELREVIARLSEAEAGAPSPGTDGVKKKPVEPIEPVIAARPPAPSTQLERPRPPVERNGVGVGEPHRSAPVDGPPAPGEHHSGSTLERIRSAWQRLGDRAEELKLPAQFRKLEPTVENGAGVVVVPVPSAYNYMADKCEAPELRSRIESHLSEALGHGVSIRFDREAASPSAGPPAAAGPGSTAHRAVLDDDLARQLVSRFEAQLRRVEAEAEPEAEPPAGGGPGAEADD
ncbi:DNA polymerase III subunit gamma/tau [Tautonia plasticadhaerens]|uniref:DNA polymerase III subunit gamma/tau n=1 Tax=Tautonia plasticadhaerens TaxID=2527974 RepID=A0A518GWE6_9BACT|nr:DNA polymerase III subunit gamma/tau [Tautonia plasticadhaerens]QDV32916.1 DNA polymerase III subunit tau [Tautonia plasticadhaerens]